MKIKEGRVYKIEKDSFWYNNGLKNVKVYYSEQKPIIGDCVALFGEVGIEPEKKKIKRTDEFRYFAKVKKFNYVNITKILGGHLEVITELTGCNPKLRKHVIKKLEKMNLPEEWKDQIELAKDIDGKAGINYL